MGMGTGMGQLEMTMDRRALIALLGATSVAGVSDPANAASSAEFPFRVTRNQAWAAVSIDGKDPMAFLIDTGSNTFGITPNAAAQLALPVITTTGLQAAVGRVKVPLYIAKTLTVGGGVREKDVVLAGMQVGNYDLISGVIPIAKFGVLGLDFDRQQMLVARSIDGQPEGYDAFETFPGGDTFGSMNRMGAYALDEDSRNTLDQRPVVEAELDGQRLRMLVDTGASMSIYLRPDYVKAKGLWDHYPRSTQSAVRTLARSALVRVARAEEFKLGRYLFQSPIIHLGNPEDSGSDGSGNFHGVIGMELIRRFNLLNHPGRRQLYLKPSQAMQDVYRYDRAGVEIDAVEGRLNIVWVRPGGPAARAGLVVGDRVTGWRGKDGYYGLVWALTGAAGTNVEIQVERAGAQTLVPVILEESI